MKALVLLQPGSPDTLQIKEVPIPEPLKGEVRVKVYAVGLNPADYKFMQRGFATWQYPFIPGLDVAGTIDKIGEGVTNYNIGDDVYYHGDFSQPGGFAQYAITTAHTIAALPKNLSYIQAAALPCAGFTAFQALYHKLHVKSGQTILIQGGAGGVGGFAIQLAKREGLKIISTASNHNFAWVRQLGADVVLDYNSEDIVLRVQELTQGRGVDSIVDAVSSASATMGFNMLAFGGSIVCIAGLPDFSGMKSFSKAFSVHDLALGGAYLSGDIKAQDMLAKIGKEFGDLVSQSNINPMIQEVIKFEEIPNGLIQLSERKVKGKIVATI